MIIVNTNMINCSKCGAEINVVLDKFAINMNNGETYPICKNCIADLIECDHCGEYISPEDATLVNHAGRDVHVCSTCLSSWYTKCNTCGKYFYNNSYEIGYHKVNGEYIDICNDCLSQIAFCDNCHERFTEVIVNEITEQSLCKKCIEKMNRYSTNTKVYSYHHSPRTYVKKYVDGDNDKIFFGVELECSLGDYDPTEMEWWCGKGLIFLELDGSIGDNGVETITQPCTLKYHQELFGWEDFCASFENMGFKSHNVWRSSAGVIHAGPPTRGDKPACGLHIHISRRTIPLTMPTKLDWLIVNGWDFFSAIGRRREIYHWDRPSEERKFSAAKNVQSQYDSRTTRYPNCAARIYDRNNYLFNRVYTSRYQPVNTRSTDTVEIRFPRGSLKHTTILATIEMIHSLIHYLSNMSIKDMKGYGAASVISQWIHDVVYNNVFSTKYSNFVALLKEKKDSDRYNELIPLKSIVSVATIESSAALERVNRRKENH